MGSECLTKWPIQRNVLIAPEGASVFQSPLIRENDESFKYWLDRYKYAVGYPEQTQQEYRDKGSEFLRKLEKRLTKQAYLLSNHCTLVDVAVFPFVRQFAFVEKQWFDDSAFTEVQRWLSGFLESKPFEVAMIKQPPWQVTIPRQSRGLSICEPLKAAVGVASRPLYSRHLKVAVQRHISI